MAKTDVDLMRGTLDLLILKALSWGPMHGLAVLHVDQCWITLRQAGECCIETPGWMADLISLIDWHGRSLQAQPAQRSAGTTIFIGNTTSARSPSPARRPLSQAASTVAPPRERTA